jgi:hypothetical protein
MADEGTYHHCHVGVDATRVFAAVNELDPSTVVRNNHNAFGVLGEGNDLDIL